MDCNKKISGLLKDCDSSMGGIKEVWITETNPKPIIENGVIKYFDNEPNWNKYYINKNTCSVVSNMVIDRSKSINFVNSNIILQFNRMDSTKRAEMVSLSVLDVYVIIKDSNGIQWYFGYDEPVVATYAIGQTGTSISDGNFYQITLTDESDELPYEVLYDVDIDDPELQKPFYIKALEYGTVYSVGKNTKLYYRLNNNANWYKLDRITVNEGDIIYFKALKEEYDGSEVYYNDDIDFHTDFNYDAGGNMMSLLFDSNFVDKRDLTGYDYCFSSYFNYEKINNINNLRLPATTLAPHCYRGMFMRDGIQNIPENLLPATTLAPYCYYSMFAWCQNLVNIPENLLPATTLAPHCYEEMFRTCTDIIYMSENLLPATTLDEYCYKGMFYACSLLQGVGKLPATTLARGCYEEMFSYCRNLYRLPEDMLPATTLARECYKRMFYYASYGFSSGKAPILPATELVSGCYEQMFESCYYIDYVKALFTTEPSSSYTYDWLSGVSSGGTFVKNPEATWDVGISRGTHTVPSDWTIVNDI